MMALELLVPLFLISGSCGFVVPPAEEYQMGAHLEGGSLGNHLLLPKFIDDMEWGTTPPSRRKICTEKNSLFLGQMTEDDDVIFEKDVEIKGEPGKILEHTVHFPEKDTTNTKKINFISAIDCDNWGDGEKPVLKSGGINVTHATIGLKSKKGKNIDFLIIIRGRDPTRRLNIDKHSNSTVTLLKRFPKGHPNSQTRGENTTASTNS